MNKLVTNKLWPCYETSLIMLNDRGYRVLSQEYTKEEFLETFENSENIWIFALNGEIRIGVVIVRIIGGFVKANFDAIIRNMPDRSVQHVIIIIDHNVNQVRIQRLKEITDQYHIEFIENRRMHVPWSRHQDVPQHILLTDDEKNTIFAEHGIDELNLPEISVTDAASIWFNAQVGQVFKIIRNNLRENIIEIYYRRVVKLVLH